MKFFLAVFLLFLFSACTKTVGRKQGDIAANTAKPGPVTCGLASNSIVSYSITISRIFKDNCLSCHSTPGSGGINLDTYVSCKTLAQGELMDIVVYNPGNIQMPPPPQNLLDSCQIKALNLWIKQGCLFN